MPQLFHLQRDPAERFDVAASHPEVVADIQAAVAAHREGLTIAPSLFDAAGGADGTTVSLNSP